jgi:putative SOS response-associated peptidase YedK
MCGRFSLTQPSEAAERFGFVDWHAVRIEPRFNIAPTQEILTIVQPAHGSPVAQVATWGFTPHWMRFEGRKRPAPINARAESLADSPMFREALISRRCLIPADGFYEWQAIPGSTARAPLHIRLKSGAVFVFAGLWAPGKGGSPPTAAIVTTRPNQIVAPIHNRMPVILHPEDEAAWLDPQENRLPKLLSLLAPFPADGMEAYAVAPLVNSFQNEGPELIVPTRHEHPTTVQAQLPL